MADHNRLALHIDEHRRTVSASPQPPGSPFQMHDESSGEGEESHFGRAKKSKRKAAPRTSRACLNCRRQKMRCKGAENPPCERCVANEVDCMFERRSDYLLNPEDRAWQVATEKRLEALGRAVDQILAHLGGSTSTMQQAAPYETMPPIAAYYTSPYDRPEMPTPANEAGRVNYVLPTPGETAAIAAQARFKRPRGNTAPGGLPSASFTPDGPFQMYSPGASALDPSGLPTPYAFPTSQGHAPHEHSQAVALQQAQQDAVHAAAQHQHHHGHGHAGGHHSHAYGFEPYSGDVADERNDRGASDAQSSVPRSLNSPLVRFTTSSNAPSPMGSAGQSAELQHTRAEEVA